MNILIYIITGILVICCILLTGVVLIQRPRSEGLGTAFGGGMTESMFGAGTSDVLTKITIWMAGAFFVCTLLLAVLISHRETSKTSVLDSVLEQAQEMEKPATTDPVVIPGPEAVITQPDTVESVPAEDSASAPEKEE